MRNMKDQKMESTGTDVSNTEQQNLEALKLRGCCTEDDAVCVTELCKAAESGDASASYQLGLLYARGRGVPQDRAEAAKWFLKGAELGCTDAMLKIGM